MEISFNKKIYPEIYRVNDNLEPIIVDKNEKDSRISDSIEFLTKELENIVISDYDKIRDAKILETHAQLRFLLIQSLREISSLCDTLTLCREKYLLSMRESYFGANLINNNNLYNNLKNNMIESAHNLDKFANNIIFTNASDCYRHVISVLGNFSIRKSSGDYLGRLGIIPNPGRVYPSVIGLPKKPAFKFNIKKLGDPINTNNFFNNFFVGFYLVENFNGNFFHKSFNNQNFFNLIFCDQDEILKNLFFSQFNLIKRQFYDWLIFQFFDAGNLPGGSNFSENILTNNFTNIYKNNKCILNINQNIKNINFKINNNLSIYIITNENNEYNFNLCSKNNCELCYLINIIEFYIFYHFFKFHKNNKNLKYFPNCSNFGFRSSKLFSEDWFENSNNFLDNKKYNIFILCSKLINNFLAKKDFKNSLKKSTYIFGNNLDIKWFNAKDFSCSSAIYSLIYNINDRFLKSKFHFKIYTDFTFDYTGHNFSANKLPLIEESFSNISPHIFMDSLYFILKRFSLKFDCNVISNRSFIENKNIVFKVVCYNEKILLSRFILSFNSLSNECLKITLLYSNLLKETNYSRDVIISPKYLQNMMAILTGIYQKLYFLPLDD